ncbi:hypothetical protein [Campylobacter rectus]|uniref:hypothetical protein n=1 Tax=Campylobacter rectus TaxID=203 RepID=UPI0028EFE4F0|nr:hypothetical protein [Campylobacter rectus]
MKDKLNHFIWFLWETKTKKTLSLLAISSIVLCAVFIRTIPNYTTQLGFELVWLSDYLKYQSGYCINEDRILDKEEIYKKAIGQYLDKKLILTCKIDEYRVYYYGSFWRSKYQIGYYELENINLQNWMQTLEKYYRDGKTTEEIFINELKAKKTDPKKYIKINLKDMSAGFDRPIIFGDYAFVLMLDYGFILHQNFFGINHGILETENINIMKERERVYYLNKKNSSLYTIKFDNCGNIDFDMYEKFLQAREAQGG